MMTEMSGKTILPLCKLSYPHSELESLNLVYDPLLFCKQHWASHPNIALQAAKLLFIPATSLSYSVKVKFEIYKADQKTTICI